VDRDEVRLLPEFRRRVELHVRGVRKFGLASHVSSRQFRSVFSFVNHVNGCLAFAQAVDATWTARARERWKKALALNAFPAE
jgi:RNA-directed DNA polymerase